MLLDMDAIVQNGVTIRPVWADGTDEEPVILLWQVGLVKPIKMMGHHIGRVPAETGADGTTLTAAILKFEDKTGIKLLIDLETVEHPNKEDFPFYVHTR